MTVSITGTKNKLLPGESNKIGTNIPYFPTRFLIYHEKLFYWYDSTNVITLELISVLSQYGHIDSLNVNGFVGIPETSSEIDERKKAAHYYFCKKNLRKYKRVVTNIALNYYKPPKLKCNDNK